TLIELLVVIAIIGLLSTIIAAPIQNARKKAKDAKKIAELKALTLALEQYAEANNNQYPTNLLLLAPRYMPVLPTFVATSTDAKNAFAYTTYTGVSGTLNLVFGYHLGVHLDVYGAALDTDRDCSGVTVGASLVSPRCVVWSGDSVTSLYVAPPSSGGVPSISSTGATGTDFDGITTGEVSTDTCTTVGSCVFDLTSQI
ncbi:MAG: prepilin-type N-terminal cleavage/methylation domain-containing protein, partial [Candidatus Paceibacterota bacterium]